MTRKKAVVAEYTMELGLPFPENQFDTEATHPGNF